MRRPQSVTNTAGNAFRWYASAVGEHSVTEEFAAEPVTCIAVCLADDHAISRHVAAEGRYEFPMVTDTGKTKFYAFCGLPVITTKVFSGLSVDSQSAGITINWDPHECAKAVIDLLQDDQTLEKYRYNAHMFAQSCTSEQVFRDVFDRTLQGLQQSHTR